MSAQEEARRHKQRYFGTGHLLLGMLDEGDGLAGLALRRWDLRAREVRQLVRRSQPESDEQRVTAVGHEFRFSRAVNDVFERADREAAKIFHNYIGTEHLLLALASSDTVGARILLDFDIAPEEVRKEIMRLLTRWARREQPWPDVLLELTRDEAEQLSAVLKQQNVEELHLDRVRCALLHALVQASQRNR